MYLWIWYMYVDTYIHTYIPTYIQTDRQPTQHYLKDEVREWRKVKGRKRYSKSRLGVTEGLMDCEREREKREREREKEREKKKERWWRKMREWGRQWLREGGREGQAAPLTATRCCGPIAHDNPVTVNGGRVLLPPSPSLSLSLSYPSIFSPTPLPQPTFNTHLHSSSY